MVLVENSATISSRAFEVHAKEHTYGVRRGLQGYKMWLPTLGGKPIHSVIQNRTEKEKGMVSILDVGAGSGHFLEDCRKTWGNKVTATGITAYKYGAPQGVEMHISDADNLKNIFDGRGFDIVVSVQVMDYLADPWKCLEASYNLLKEQGVALINEFPIRSRFVGSERALQNVIAVLRNTWEMEITFPYEGAGFCNIAARNSGREFVSPVPHSGAMIRDFGGAQYKVFTYSD